MSYTEGRELGYVEFLLSFYIADRRTTAANLGPYMRQGDIIVLTLKTAHLYSLRVTASFRQSSMR